MTKVTQSSTLLREQKPEDKPASVERTPLSPVFDSDLTANCR